jgi:hypothetical protein
MAIVDLSNSATRATYIANGAIWSAPGRAIGAAIEDINAGRVPVPAYIPDEYRPYIKAGEVPVEQPAVAESMPDPGQSELSADEDDAESDEYGNPYDEEEEVPSA